MYASDMAICVCSVPMTESVPVKHEIHNAGVHHMSPLSAKDVVICVEI